MKFHFIRVFRWILRFFGENLMKFCRNFTEMVRKWQNVSRFWKKNREIIINHYKSQLCRQLAKIDQAFLASVVRELLFARIKRTVSNRRTEKVSSSSRARLAGKRCSRGSSRPARRDGLRSRVQALPAPASRSKIVHARCVTSAQFLAYGLLSHSRILHFSKTFTLFLQHA